MTAAAVDQLLPPEHLDDFVRMAIRELDNLHEANYVVSGCVRQSTKLGESLLSARDTRHAVTTAERCWWQWFAVAQAGPVGLARTRAIPDWRYSFEFFQEDQADLSSRNRPKGAARLQGLPVLKGFFPGREVDAQ